MSALQNLARQMEGNKRERRYTSGPCPFCGGEDRFTIVRFNDGRLGWLCRHCAPGRYHTEREYNDRIGQPVQIPDPAPLKPPQRQQTAPEWRKAGERFVAAYEAHPDRYALWRAHKPISEETIYRRRFGVGVLPSSQCKHSRLILPVYGAGGDLVCLRGRSLGCGCPKWLTAGGWSLSTMPLYGLDEPHDPGATLWIVENPVDALLVRQMTTGRHWACATLSVSYWSDAWLEAIRETAPARVVVAYDNDLVGNGGAVNRPAMLAAWRAALPPNRRDMPEPQPNGCTLAARLANGLRVPVRLFDWGTSPHKADIGSLLTRL